MPFFPLISVLSQSVPPPQPPPTITLSVRPGHTLWSGESLVLECKVSTARHRRPGTSAVWHRALLDPAGRRRVDEIIRDLLDPRYPITRTPVIVARGDVERRVEQVVRWMPNGSVGVLQPWACLADFHFS